MMISTRGRYALRILIDLAQHEQSGFTSLKGVAQRQNVSLKYLEYIASQLCKAGLLQSSRGKEGGYRLTRPASELDVREVICASEGKIAVVSCKECEGDVCENAGECKTLPLWRNLEEVINGYLSGVTVQMLMDGELDGETANIGTD